MQKVKSVLYIAPFFEQGVLADSATAYVKALSKHHEVVCRAIGNKECNNEYIKQFFPSNKKCDNLIIHATPDQFVHDADYNCIGITHLKSPLLSHTNYQNRFKLMDFVFHDSSFPVEWSQILRPTFEASEYVVKERKPSGVYRFLAVGSPSVFEEIFQLIRGYCEAFRVEESVELTIKLPLSTDMNSFHQAVQVLQKDTRKYNIPMYPAIHFNNMWLERKELLEYYQGFDCIVNTSTNNKWSRPVIDFILGGGRCISLLEGNVLSTKMAYGPSEYRDYPRGLSHTFTNECIGKQLREAYRGIYKNSVKVDEFTVLPEALENSLL